MNSLRLLNQASEHRKNDLKRMEVEPNYTPDAFVYFLSNPSFEEIKIGFTTRLIYERLHELNASTSLPLPFELIGYIATDNAQKLESKLHKTFSQHRVNPKREFFNITRAEVEECVSKFSGIWKRDTRKWQLEVENDDGWARIFSPFRTRKLANRKGKYNSICKRLGYRIIEL